ncbi:adenosylcobinamide-GDP ribazoletransferase [Steroidobacter sp. S1-65]|uniref:Adenosylcobinamide-GDP ribazoletransferase n=1 Tax=Steroidobacter gossypii TaxID=2805490 RepID=A0ABS1X2R7_9GAMM|nr:adenosylcobinamide-GDP ribazoletransferase [Steroidobacter gossypii]MBM0107523.1 adenosylcobinamide-GDP ribazoletransferase [Steroidobacter gossypii]
MSSDAHTARPSRLLTELRLLLMAVQYFTRVPMPGWVGHSTEQLSGTARYLTTVGIFIGVVGAAVLWATSLILPAPLPVILSTAATLLLTGAFHEDGLADTFDGLGGGATRERALEIMKDSRVGTYGVAALVLTLLIKVAALSALPVTLAIVVLIAGHAFSRTCAVALLFAGRYVGNPELSRARAVAQPMGRGEFLFAAIVGVAPLYWCGMHAIAGVISALLVLYRLARWFVRRLGGFTGDTLGAAQQLTEITFYVAVLASWNST